MRSLAEKRPRDHHEDLEIPVFMKQVVGSQFFILTVYISMRSCFPHLCTEVQSMKNRQHDPLNMLKRDASLRWSTNLKLLHNGHLARQYLLSKASLHAFLVEVGQPVATVNCKSFTSMWHNANQLWPSDLEMNPAGWTLRHVRRPSSGRTSISTADPHSKKAFHLKQILAI